MTTQALPRSREAASALPPCPEVVEEAKARGVVEVLHFTTVVGAVGILDSQHVMTRHVLPSTKHLEHVYRPNAVNAQRQRDLAWHDYVNLSLSRINDWMFNFSVREQRQYDASWVVLSFRVEMLGSPGVVFTTTNNTYSGCTRAEGLDGFRRMFQPSVTRWTGNQIARQQNHPSHWPTDRQAEVLYPGDLPLTFLERIDVQNEVALDDVNGIRGALGISTPARIAEGSFR